MAVFRATILLVGLVLGQLLALDPSQPVGSYMRTRFGKENGLASGVVNVILQTQDGFLWVGTGSGLVRFDGTYFTTIEFSPKTQTEGLTRALAEGPDGDLWAGTNKGVLRIPKAALGQFGPLPSTTYHLGTDAATVTALHVCRNGTVWASTDGALYRLEGDVFSTVIPNVSVSRIEEAANGNLLVVTSQGFVELNGFHIVPHPDLAERLGIANNQFFHVMEDHSGIRWYCTAAGVAREFNGSIQNLQPYGLRLGRPAFRAYEDSESNMWLNVADGLFRATANGFERVPDTQARYIYADREGDLWLASNGQGMIRMKNRIVQMFTTAEGLPNNTTISVLKSSDGRLWVGSRCGLSVFDGQKFRIYSEKDGLANTCVNALAEDSKKNIWIGTHFGGVFRFHNGSFKQFSKPEGLRSDIIDAILPMSDGSIWLGTPDGISHMENGHFRNYTTADGLSSNHTDNLYLDRRGTLWAAMSSGVDRFSADRFSTISQPSQTHDYKVLMEDPLGGLYGAASPIGIFRIEGDQLVSVAERPKVSGMIRSQDQLWVCGEGLSRVAPSSLQLWEHGHETPQDYASYGPGDGLLSTECSTGTPDLAVTSDGKLWAAMLNGLAMIDLPRLPRNSPKPAIYMEEITVGRTSQPPGRELVLSPGPHHVDLHFGVIELASPEKIRMQYRLDGVDQDWLDANTPSNAIYSSVPLGTHELHIRACNRDGVWDRVGITYKVTQLPYFYETHLFQIAVLAILGMTLAGAYRYRLSHLTAEMNARLDERVIERTRLARDLHDTLIQTIHGTKMVADAGLDDPKDPAALQRALQRVSDVLEQASQEGRAALSALRSSAMQRTDLAEAIEQAAEDCVPKNSMSFSLTVEGNARDIHPIVRDEVYRIAYEAMRNACSHSKGTRLEVKLSYARGLVIRVVDNGIGIDKELLTKGREGHFGIKGMRERAERIGATLLFISASSGTGVELMVPRNVAFREKTVARPKKWRRFFDWRGWNR